MSYEGCDVRFDSGEMGFSYRVAAVCVRNDTILLQHEVGGDEYAFPGGHVGFGETAAEALKRELNEEMGTDAEIGDLLYTAEIFFEWNGKKYQQICLFFAAALPDDIPANGNFLSCEKTTGGSPKLEFCRVPFDKLESIKVYPDEVIRTVLSGDLQKKHIVYKE